MAVKSSDQITIVDLTDAYSVILTNESHTFPGDTDSVNGTQTATTQIIAMCGGEQVAASVDAEKITCPTGVSASSDGKSPAPTITITATSSCTAGGTVTIPVVVGDGVTINKQFTFGIAFTGKTGATGKGIKSTATTYHLSTSGTTAPTDSDWSTTPLAPTTSQYLWTRTITTYSDNTTSTAYSVGGKVGAQGNKGADIKVSGTKYAYQLSTSGTTVPTDTWSDTPVAPTTTQYAWTRTTVTYSDGSTTTTYTVGGKVGAKGDQGVQGPQGNAGADAITLAITSSAGFIFKNSSIATTLTAHVYKAGAEVTGTALSALGTIKWYKDGGTTAVGTGSTLSISAGSVTNKATYTAQLEA